jgi:hypothetical protein
LKAQNAEKCAIRPSYSASVRTREAHESCPAGAGGEGILGLADSGARGVGTPQDGVLQDRAGTPYRNAKPPRFLNSAPVSTISQQARSRQVFSRSVPRAPPMASNVQGVRDCRNPDTAGYR